MNVRYAETGLYPERVRLAQENCSRLEVRIRLLMDPDDKICIAYGARPARLYLVGRDGKIVYAGEQGPSRFQPDELEAASEYIAASAAAVSKRDDAAQRK